jgi:FMN phosphatase YigB (HAD superfamily)
MNIAVFDIDGVLADFNGLIVDIFGEGRGEELYDLRERYNGNVQQVLEVWEDPNYYYPLNPIKEGFQLLEQAWADHDILLLTSRPKVGMMESFTEKWVRKQIKAIDLEFGDLLGVNFVANKAAYLHSFKKDIAFFVDDNPEEIEEASKLGIPAYSWAQPWNEDVYPKLFPERGGTIWMQETDYKEPVRFWQKDE